MQIFFRVDASLQIGAGHVMRCLTLADALREHGAQCTFVCRPHPGNLLGLIVKRGHAVIELREAIASYDGHGSSEYAEWLGATWADDAEQTRHVLCGQLVNWLVVDHYSLDCRWEQSLRANAEQIMVIDDLADRSHECEVLLDQTYGRFDSDYKELVPGRCKLLCGSKYALLRPDFALLRQYSLARRSIPALNELLVTMGGIDKDNVTGAVLTALQNCHLPEDCRLTVVMGETAPWLQAVKQLASEMQRPTRVLIGVADMAQLMADSDLAIGAAGATSWERCCLGLPTIMLVIADNQMKVAQGLDQAGAVLVCKSGEGLQIQLNFLLQGLRAESNKLSSMCIASSALVDGRGVKSVLKFMGA